MNVFPWQLCTLSFSLYSLCLACPSLSVTLHCYEALESLQHSASIRNGCSLLESSSWKTCHASPNCLLTLFSLHASSQLSLLQHFFASHSSVFHLPFTHLPQKSCVFHVFLYSSVKAITLPVSLPSHSLVLPHPLHLIHLLFILILFF